MMEDGEWNGKPKMVSFSEVNNVNIIVYDAMSCSIPYLITENENATHTIYFLMIHSNHFNRLRVNGE